MSQFTCLDDGYLMNFPTISFVLVIMIRVICAIGNMSGQCVWLLKNNSMVKISFKVAKDRV